MSKEPKVDRVKFKEGIDGYFRESPVFEFLVYDGGLTREPAEAFRTYTALKGIDVIVVKVGTSIVQHKDDRGKQAYNMHMIAEDMTALRDGGYHMLLVTSGAIGVGRELRKSVGDPIPSNGAKLSEEETLRQKQRDAQYGWKMLFKLWKSQFLLQKTRDYLVTHNDMMVRSKREWYLGQYSDCFDKHIIPAVNENDMRSIEEIDVLKRGVRVFGDNDGLASLHAQLLKQAGWNPLLILMSNTDGIYARESVADGTYVPIRIVKNSDGLEDQAAPISSTRGRGGIIAKIGAARDAANAGVPTIIVNGQYSNHDTNYQRREPGSERKYRPLDAILRGAEIGTWFLPVGYGQKDPLPR